MMPTLPTPQDSRAASAESPRDRDCGFGFRIRVRGDLHRHNQCASESTPTTPGDALPCLRPPAAGNACLPPLAGRKHKPSPAEELAPRSVTTCVPSSRAVGAMQLARRFLAGASAGNELEHGRLAV